MVTFKECDLLSVATYVQGPEKVPSFILNTRNHPIRNGFYSIYAFQYPDGSKYAVQLPTYMPHESEEERSAISTTIDEEIKTLEHLVNVKFPWSPRPVTYSSNFENVLKFPFMTLSLMHGDHLQWNDQVPADLKVREKVMMQLAHIMIDLARVTEQTGMTCERFLLDIVDKKTLAVIREEMVGVNIVECLQLRKLVREAFVIPNEVYSHPGECLEGCTHMRNNERCMRNVNRLCTKSSTSISHEDLTADNIIIDTDYNIQGLINWSFAKRLPMRLALRLPRLLSIESHKLEDTADDIPVQISRYLVPSQKMQQDREAYAFHLNWALIQEIPASTTAGSTIAECAPLACEVYDIDWKHLIFMASYSTRTHWWMARRKWLLDGTFAHLSGKLLDQEKGWDNDVPLEAYRFAERNISEHGTAVRKKFALKNFRRSKAGQTLKWEYVFRWLYGHFREKVAVVEGEKCGRAHPHGLVQDVKLGMVVMDRMETRTGFRDVFLGCLSAARYLCI